MFRGTGLLPAMDKTSFSTSADNFGNDVSKNYLGGLLVTHTLSTDFTGLLVVNIPPRAFTMNN